MTPTSPVSQRCRSAADFLRREFPDLDIILNNRGVHLLSLLTAAADTIDHQAKMLTDALMRERVAYIVKPALALAMKRMPALGETWVSSQVMHQGLLWRVENVSDDVVVFRDTSNPDHSCHVGKSQLVYGWSPMA